MKLLLLLVVVVGVCFGEAPIGRSPGQGEVQRAKRNTCSYYATDNDMNQLGLLNECSDWCTNYFGLFFLPLVLSRFYFFSFLSPRQEA